MDQEVFKANFFSAIILPIIITVAILGIYVIADDVPFWLLLFLVIPILFAVAGQKTKLIISDGVLRYEQVFSKEEVDLKKVSQIVIREVETIVEKNSHSVNHNQSSGLQRNINQVNQERKVEKLFYLLDESGRTIFSFPANIVGYRDRRRFEEAVITVNPNIEVS